MSTSPRTPAPELPVARVLPLLRVAHLDREFDYLIDSEQSKDVAPGVMVRVRFSGKLVDALVMDRVDSSGHSGKLAWIDRVISPTVVAPKPFRELFTALARRYGGLRSDVIRAAIPPRHAAAEKASIQAGSQWEGDGRRRGEFPEEELQAWENYHFGRSFIQACENYLDARFSPEATGTSGATSHRVTDTTEAQPQTTPSAPRAAWQIIPGDRWYDRLAQLAVRTATAGGGVLIVVPDHRECTMLERSLAALISAKQFSVLTSQLGRQARYRRYMDIVLGHSRIVIGTRAAAFAPVKDLSLIAIFDDGDDLLVDPRSPYMHARDVLTLRASRDRAAMIIGGYSRTAEAELLVQSGWAHNLVPEREALRRYTPAIHALGETDRARADDAVSKSKRIPSLAFQAIRRALDRNRPVIVHVPRKGYIPTLSCRRCGTPARCRACHGPLSVPDEHTTARSEYSAPGSHPTCRWCGRQDSAYRCPTCGDTHLRARVIGASRTAEEIGRAFSGVPIHLSSGTHILESIPAGKRIVIATPGAIPRFHDDDSDCTYGAAVLLDVWAQLSREDVRAQEEALSSWMQVASLVDSSDDHGEVVIAAESHLPLIQSFIRWDPVGAARGELQGRIESGFPPAVHMAAIDGTEEDIAAFRTFIELPEGTQALGPVPLPPGMTPPAGMGPGVECWRLLLRTPSDQGASALGTALQQARVKAGLHKMDGSVRVIVDPIHIG